MLFSPFSYNSSFITIHNVVAARLCFHRHLSFCSQGEGRGCDRHPTSRPPGRHPFQADPPGQTPQQIRPLGRHPLVRHPLARHPLPSACWDAHPPCPVHAGIHPPAQCMLAATASDDMHPTGMHSCSVDDFCAQAFLLYFYHVLTEAEWHLQNINTSLKISKNAITNAQNGCTTYSYVM